MFKIKKDTSLSNHHDRYKKQLSSRYKKTTYFFSRSVSLVLLLREATKDDFTSEVETSHDLLPSGMVGGINLNSFPPNHFHVGSSLTNCELRPTTTLLEFLQEIFFSY